MIIERIFHKNDRENYPKEHPEVLYKYRDWDEKWHKVLINENELFFSSSKGFNDPFDANIPFRYNEEDLTDANIFRKLFEVGQANNPDKSDAEIVKMCYEEQRSGIFNTDEYWMRKYEVLNKMTQDNYGICSLTTKNNNLLMWSHYSNSHKGFCIGFDTKELYYNLECILGPVIYEEKMPTMPLFPETPLESLKLLITKSPEWKYEEEYRLVKMLSSNKSYKLPDNVFKELIIGMKMSEENKKELIEIAIAKYKGISIYQSKMNLKDFKIDLEKIN